MTQHNGVVTSLIWKASERVIVQGIGFLVQIILARLLLPEDFACLAIINAIVSYLGLFVQSGLLVTVVQKKELTKEDLSTLTTISLLVALVLFVALYFSAPLISDYYEVGDLIWPIRVMGISLFLYSFNSIQTGILTREMKFRTIFFRSLLATPLSGIIGIVMAYLGLGIWALVVYSISNIFFTILFMNLIPELRLKLGFSKQSAKEMYSFSLKILGTNLISSGGDTIRTLTIGKFYNSNQLAYFDRGLTYSALVTQIVNTTLSSVLLPAFSRSQENVDQLRELTRRSVSLSGFVMIPFLVLVAIMAEPLVRLILTEKWVPCAIFLSIFCILRIPGVITSIDKQVYYALGKSQIGLYYEIALLVLNLITLFVLLPYGILAIAIGFTTVEYLGNSILCIISSRVFSYTLKERLHDLFKSSLSSLIMAIVVYSLSLLGLPIICSLLLQIIFGLGSYLLMARIIKDENLDNILNIVNRK